MRTFPSIQRERMLARTMSEPSNQTFRVVVNHEEQYSIWPAYKEIPAGWRAAGKDGSKEECLAFIEEVWVDMRPLSLRKQLANGGSSAEE